MTAPTEKQFVIFQRGEARELWLAAYRNGLRGRIDPDTGATITETKIKRVTQAGSRFYVGADALDLMLLAGGKRAEFLSQQISHDRSGHAFLEKRHAETWGQPFLPGFSATGTVLAKGTPGITFIGSTTIPSPFATYGVDPKGNRFQVYINGTTDANREAELVLASIDVGLETNIAEGTIITWVNPPLGADPTAVVIDADFSGGQPAETDDAYIPRLTSRIRHKPAAGNAAQFRAWAREAAVSVEDAFIYPAAFHAGSVLVVPTQKRGSGSGPTARIPSTGVLTATRDRVVPPASPVVPDRPRVLVLPPVAVASSFVLNLALVKADAAGWVDIEPFPTSRGALTSIAVTTVNSQTDFRFSSGASGQLPGGATGPLTGVHLMIWNDATSRFESLDVNTVEDLTGGIYRVLLNSAPTKTITVGDRISPDTARRDAIAVGLEEYFDSLGPGEVVDLSGTDTRSVSAFRRPQPSEEWPQRAGQAMISFITETLGQALADANLDVISPSTPTVPSDPLVGPNLLTLGKVNLLPL